MKKIINAISELTQPDENHKKIGNESFAKEECVEVLNENC